MSKLQKTIVDGNTTIVRSESSIIGILGLIIATSSACIAGLQYFDQKQTDVKLNGQLHKEKCATTDKDSLDKVIKIITDQKGFEEGQ